MAKDLPQLLRLRIEIISGTSFPSSFSRPEGQTESLMICSARVSSYLTKLEARLQTKADLRHSVCQLLLDELVGSERTTLTQDMRD